MIAKREFTEWELTFARAARMECNGWSPIARYLNCHHDTLRKALDPTYRQPKPPEPRRAEIPPDVARERDRTINAPRTLTALLLGDPAPGRSALDRVRRPGLRVV